MHKITPGSLCDALDTFITCFILRTLLTQNFKMPKSIVHFLVHHEYRFFIVRLFCVLK